MSVVSHLVLSCPGRYSLFSFRICVDGGRFPHLQRLEIDAPDGAVNVVSSGHESHFFAHLASHCPRLVWLDLDLRVRWYDVDVDDDATPSKVDWPEDRQRLDIVFHNHQPEEGGVAWLEPWRFFKGNVSVIDDPEEIEESKKKAETQWVVSPYRSLV